MINVIVVALVASIILVSPALAAPDGPVLVIAHVDLTPDGLAQGLPLLEQFAQQSKTDTGVESFELITWAETNNHFQLIQIYRSLQAFNNHVRASHTVTFRSALQPFIGAPYDERLYSPSNSGSR
jgi:quinol monooxygenase YgiN